MSAQVLRDAARLMRSRALGATASPWVEDDSTPALCVYSPMADTFVTSPTDWDADGRDTRHIAGMHPGVALAVADWLESVAGALTPPPPESPLGIVDCGRAIAQADERHALKVAHAYLGTPSEVAL